jgi:arginyl-tRNA synthetase
MTFDIELTRQRSLKKADRLIWVVGVDQKLYFQQLFAVCEMLGYGQRSDFHHFAYGMVRLPQGKMSSRKGTVVYADDLIEAAQDQAETAMDETNVAKTFTPEEKKKVISAVGVGAVKWTMLSQDPESEITFNLQESVSFKGFAGPYIQYTMARSHSVLEKAQNGYINKPIDTLLNILIDKKASTSKEESDLLRNLIKYFDMVKRSANNYTPHLLCVYLFELSQSFNAFYAACPILTKDAEAQSQMEQRLVLTMAVEKVLQRGLELLGITTVQKM